MVRWMEMDGDGAKGANGTDRSLFMYMFMFMFINIYKCAYVYIQTQLRRRHQNHTKACQSLALHCKISEIWLRHPMRIDSGNHVKQKYRNG